jgi:uncharacterized protein (TIGR04255 family)
MSSKKKVTKARRTRARQGVRLPSAPLAEVVFELRWELQQGIFPFDPLLAPSIARFSKEIDQMGFKFTQDISSVQQTGPYGVARRFLRAEDMPFPIMQIGAGIFATNESVKYEWQSFKAQVLQGIKALLRAYPQSIGFSLRPNYLELRYVDVFDKAVIGDKDLFDFAESGTSLRFKLPDVLFDRNMFWGDASGRFFFQRSLRGRKDSTFAIDLSSGRNMATKQDVLQLVSRVASSGVGVPPLGGTTPFLKQIGDWLEFAHNVTSPFFKHFILKDVMDKFRVVPDGRVLH